MTDTRDKVRGLREQLRYHADRLTKHDGAGDTNAAFWIREAIKALSTPPAKPSADALAKFRLALVRLANVIKHIEKRTNKPDWDLRGIIDTMDEAFALATLPPAPVSESELAKALDKIDQHMQRTANSPDLYENANIGITFRAVWWPMLKAALPRFGSHLAATEGMRLVPVEPTQEMIDAISFHSTKYAAEPTIKKQWQIIDLHRSNPIGEPINDPDEAHNRAKDLGALDGYRAMLAAAPQPERKD